MRPSNSARDELQRRLMFKLAEAGIENAEVAARIVVEAFYRVSDSWQSTNITTFSDDGFVELEDRYLVAEMPVQHQRHERLAERHGLPD